MSRIWLTTLQQDSTNAQKQIVMSTQNFRAFGQRLYFTAAMDVSQGHKSTSRRTSHAISVTTDKQTYASAIIQHILVLYA